MLRRSLPKPLPLAMRGPPVVELALDSLGMTCGPMLESNINFQIMLRSGLYVVRDFILFFL